MVFYTRAERHPSWLPDVAQQQPFPVVVGHEPAVGRRLIARVMQDAWQARRFSIFEVTIDGSRYQVVALLSYTDALDESPAGALGFLVNLQWAREYYFGEIAEQVAQIEGSDGGVQFVVLDDESAPVVEHGITMPALERAPQGRRRFPLAFFDPIGVAIDPPKDLAIASWTAVASALQDPTLGVAERGARRTLGVAMVMAVALTAGIVLSLKAARTNARLGEMRADFVSAVTHELKTPIANLRAISETMASRRSTLDMSREYAQMGIREAGRLSRLVDNLLAYARITDVADVYTFEAVAIDTVVDQALQEFALNLKDGRFELDIDVPDNLPVIRGDPTALGLMLNNLIDNAIRYSKGRRYLSITARQDTRTITLTVSDHGVGIPQQEIQRVRQKFQRGRDAQGGGSGLGLAIVERIVADHGGSLNIQSVNDVGTTVAVTLPVMT